jgi:transposase InsO family protein
MDLRQLYKDPKFSGAFAGRRQFYRSVKEKYPNVKWKQIVDYLKSDDGYTLHRPVKKPRKYRRVITKHINYLWQVDLVDMSAHAEHNKDYRWIIMVIDCFSKKLWAIKTKRKTGSIITNAVKNLLTIHKPLKIQYDDGGEFLNSHFQKLLKKLRIKGYSISSARKACIIERACRTIKTRMYR